MDILNVRRTEKTGPRTGLSEQEFTLLYQNDLARVLNYVRYRLGMDDAEEITASIFARVWECRKQYDSHKGTPQVWLWAIVRNTIKDSWRQKKQIPVSVDLAVDLISDNDTLNEIIKIDEWQKIQSALSHLPAIDREIIALRFGAGLTNRTIAEMIHMQDATVAQRLHRALKKLRVELDGGNSL